jgi:signal transduction histidine kinase
MTTRRILVVDDDAHILEVLTMRLEAMGCDVTAANDPRRAVELASAHAFDAALVDLRMEPLDGIAVLLRLHEHQPRLPVLIMTAHGTIERAVDAIKRGAFDFLTKPFVPEELSSKLGRALAERRWARDLTFLQTVGETLASCESVDRVLEIVTQATMDATETERAVLFLRDGNRTVARAHGGMALGDETRLWAAAEEAITRGKVAHVPARNDRRAVLAAPLVVDGVAQGALAVESPGPVVTTRDDEALLALFASQAAVAVKTAADLTRLRSGALAALGRVATEVAHEINNPLGGMRLWASVLGRRAEKMGDAEGAEMATKLGHAADRLAELVQDITAFARPAALRREPVGVNALVEEAIALVQDRVAARGVRVATRLDATLGEQVLDARILSRALLNLVVNAIDAMMDGGTLTVRTARDGGGTVTIGVEDTGCGMDRETATRAFDLFFTTKAEGTGLGMAIARAAVERHGGRLEIDSAPGRGTRVCIVLPADGNAAGDS